MAVIIWSDATVKSCALEVLAISNVGVSVAVWKSSGGVVTLRCKSSDGAGVWPADSTAHIIATLTKSEPFFIRQQRDGRLLVGNGKDTFYGADTGQPTSSSDWAPVNII